MIGPRTRLAACWLATLLTGCRQAPPPPAALTAVTWRLTWDASRLQRTQAGWRWHTDFGYDVLLREGQLTTWRLGLELCPKVTAGSQASWWWQMAAWSPVSSAWAHHVEPPDPTSLMPHLTEDLLVLPSTDVGPRALPPGRYCRGLWLVSAPPQALAGASPRVSLRLRGTWQKGLETGTFELSPWLPAARFDEVAGLAAVDGAARIVVQRHLADALDGVELADAATETLAWHVLQRLTSRATWRIER